MSLKRASLAIAVLTFASLLSAAEPDLVIPVAGSVHGDFGSQWHTELTLHNAGAEAALVTLTFISGDGTATERTVTVAARSTVTYADVISGLIGKTEVLGALTIDVNDAVLPKLVVAARIYNESAAGQFGQNVPALPYSSAFGPGDVVILAAPGDAAAQRFNFGVFTTTGATIDWELHRRDGTVAARVTRTYAAGVQKQYNQGTVTFFGVQPADSDVVYARIIAGRTFLYASAVNLRTNDPSFVNPVRTRENLTVRLLGVDADENGSIEILDANNDGVLDQPVNLIKSRFPNFFRVAVQDPEGAKVVLSLPNGPSYARIIDENGTIQAYPGGEITEATGQLVVRATDGIDTVDFIIPVNFL